MKVKNIVWASSLLDISMASTVGHFHNPGLRYAKFVFCDDQANENGQGIEYEDFDIVAQSGIGTPVKMRFLGEAVSAHVGSIPIGHITEMVENTLDSGVHQLIAQAVLYANEYPDEIGYLEEAFANNKAPGISFEMTYKDAVVKAGVSWLKGIITRAATFVRNPAYGSRTALLALASSTDISEEDLSKGLSAFAEEFRPKTTTKGGNNKVTEEELQAKLTEAQTKITELTTKVGELETANASLVTDKEALSTQLSEKDTALAAFAEKELVAKRTQTITDAGIKIETDPEKLSKKQAFWVHMDEEAFAEYVDDLKVASKPEKAALASLHRAEASRVAVPRLAPEAGANLSDLKSRLGSLSR